MIDQGEIHAPTYDIPKGFAEKTALWRNALDPRRQRTTADDSGHNAGYPLP